MFTSITVKLPQRNFPRLVRMYKVQTGSAHSRKSAGKVESIQSNSSTANRILYGQQARVLFIRSLLLAKYRENEEQDTLILLI